MFEQFFDALASVLNFIYTLVPSGIRDVAGFGLAIMGLTVLVMALITPLTVKSTRSMLQMQRLQPEMKRMQEKYKDDREKLNAGVDGVLQARTRSTHWAGVCRCWPRCRCSSSCTS